jgi:hypothetical protein
MIILDIWWEYVADINSNDFFMGSKLLLVFSYILCRECLFTWEGVKFVQKENEFILWIREVCKSVISKIFRRL